MGNATRQLQNGVNRLFTPQPMVSSGLHPFKIYRVPAQYRFTPLADPTTTWRAVRVRGGLILNTTISPSNLPTGTDKVDQPYQDVYANLANGTFITGVTDIIVPASTANYWIWVDLSSNSVSYGANPSSPDVGSAWVSWPNVDPTKVMVGWVDTNTLASQSQPIIRQIQTTDILSTGGAGAMIRRFQINTVSGALDMYSEYFIAKDIDHGSTLTRIAKNYKLRNSITSATIDGTSWTYTYTTPIERTATTSGYSEYQRVSPRYLAADYLLAENVGQTVLSGSSAMVSVADTISGTPGAAITWIDRNEDGRAWAAKRDQTGP